MNTQLLKKHKKLKLWRSRFLLVLRIAREVWNLFKLNLGVRDSPSCDLARPCSTILIFCHFVLTRWHFDYEKYDHNLTISQFDNFLQGDGERASGTKIPKEVQPKKSTITVGAQFNITFCVIKYITYHMLHMKIDMFQMMCRVGTTKMETHTLSKSHVKWLDWSRHD